MQKKKSFDKANLWRIPISLLIIMVHIIPIYILVGVAFKSPKDLTSRWILPGYIHAENFQIALTKGNMLNALTNTTLITICAILGITLLGALAAYPLARNRTKFNQGIKAFVMGIMMIPPLSILVPLYSTMVRLDGTSTFGELSLS